MKKPVTVEMFRQFVEDSGYKIVGYNANELIALLTDPKTSDDTLTYVNHEDATAFVAWRKEKTGQDLRMPTENEWLAAKNAVGNQLTGGLWEWTQTIYSGVVRVLRSLFDGSSFSYRPASRYYDLTVRLVEDKITA
jgi:formylglycine-generating enzyme required for sulfatase activity